MNTNFEKDSIAWQIQLLQQRFGEWFELTFNPTIAKTLNSVGVPPDAFWDNLLNLFWGIFSIVCILLGLKFYRWLSPYLERLLALQIPQKIPQSQQNLERNFTVDQWLNYAQKLPSQGDYAGACRALYMAMLQRLHEAEILPNDKSKTDREYITLIRQNSRFRFSEFLFITHEEICFTDVNITSDIFERCQNIYQQIDQQINSLQKTPR
jgi:hypothetical protein